jgi:hypothetical protein
VEARSERRVGARRTGVVPDLNEVAWDDILQSYPMNHIRPQPSGAPSKFLPQTSGSDPSSTLHLTAITSYGSFHHHLYRRMWRKCQSGGGRRGGFHGSQDAEARRGEGRVAWEMKKWRHFFHHLKPRHFFPAKNSSSYARCQLKTFPLSCVAN